MNTKKNMTDKVEELLKSAGNINEVKVSPFFKDKTLDRMFAANEELPSSGFSWFTPKLQWAALVIIFLANSYVLYNANQNNYNEKLDQFAETYQLNNSTQGMSSFLK